jgi:hypothetical protein
MPRNSFYSSFDILLLIHSWFKTLWYCSFYHSITLPSDSRPCNITHIKEWYTKLTSFYFEAFQSLEKLVWESVMSIFKYLYMTWSKIENTHIPKIPKFSHFSEYGIRNVQNPGIFEISESEFRNIPAGTKLADENFEHFLTVSIWMLLFPLKNRISYNAISWRSQWKECAVIPIPFHKFHDFGHSIFHKMTHSSLNKH